MKLSRNKINKLLKINNQSRKNRHHIKNKAKSLHTFSDDELILTGDKDFIKARTMPKARTMHARPRPLNLRFKTLKNKRNKQAQEGGSSNTIQEAWLSVNRPNNNAEGSAFVKQNATILLEIVTNTLGIDPKYKTKLEEIVKPEYKLTGNNRLFGEIPAALDTPEKQALFLQIKTRTKPDIPETPVTAAKSDGDVAA